MDPSDAQVKVSKALKAVAKRKDTILTSIAQAYVTAKAPYVFPIVGGRNVEHLKGNIEALTIKLSDDDIKEIEDVVPFDLGFPMSFLYGEELPDNPGDLWVLAMGGTLDHVPEPKPFGTRCSVHTLNVPDFLEELMGLKTGLEGGKTQTAEDSLDLAGGGAGNSRRIETIKHMRRLFKLVFAVPVIFGNIFGCTCVFSAAVGGGDERAGLGLGLGL